MDRIAGRMDEGWRGERRADVVVVGGGIAGLVAATTAASAGADVVVLDAHEPGGRARTTVREGWSLNIGPHAVYAAGELQRTLDRFGISLPGGSPRTGGVGLVHDGERTVVTMTPTGLARARVLSLRSRARLVALFARMPRMHPEDLVGRTVGEWLADEPLDVQRFLGAFIRVSTYTHAPDRFDAGAALAQLQLALHGVRYLDGGWIRIVDGLSAVATRRGATIVGHVAVDAIEPDGEHVIVRAGAATIVARTVVLAAGGPDVAARLTGATVVGRDALTEPVRAASLDLATRNPYPDCFSLGLDRPLYLSPHAPTAVLAPPGAGLVERDAVPRTGRGRRRAERGAGRAAPVRGDRWRRPRRRGVRTSAAPERRHPRRAHGGWGRPRGSPTDLRARRAGRAAGG